MSGGGSGLGLSDNFINIRKHFVLNKSGVVYLVAEVMNYEEHSGGRLQKQRTRLNVVF